MGVIRKLVFGFDLADVEAERLGFTASPHAEGRARIQGIIDCFIHSYNVTLELDPDLERVASLLNMLEPDLRGFAHEGAAMAVAMGDILRTPSRRRFNTFAAEIAPHHSYMAYIGAGIALSATFRKPSFYWSSLDPFTRWLVYNGVGFHHAFFRTAKTLVQHRVPAYVSGVGLSEFDAGIGRGLWFVLGANPTLIHETIETFPAERRADVWSGVGLASAYASGVAREVIETLFDLSQPHQAAVAQGAVLAAHTRHRANNPAPHVGVAADVYWGLSAEALHEIAEESILGSQHKEAGAPAEQWTRFVEDLRGRYTHQVQAIQEVA